jgi:pyridoxal 5'-phosphate synthase pdxT subunit
MSTRIIGVLALQGAFAAHRAVLRALGHDVVLVRWPGDLVGLDGLVLPGGESTVQLELLSRLELDEPLCRFLRSGAPVLATCAGLILAARPYGFGVLDVDVERNAWGTQVDSFEAISDDGLPLVFIRAPRIRRVGSGVETRARFRGEPVLVRQGNVVGATFHPELTSDLRLHEALFGRSGGRTKGIGAFDRVGPSG